MSPHMSRRPNNTHSRNGPASKFNISKAKSSRRADANPYLNELNGLNELNELGWIQMIQIDSNLTTVLTIVIINFTTAIVPHRYTSYQHPNLIPNYFALEGL